MELKPCPFCGEKPIIKQVGDRKQYMVFFCEVCGKTPVHSSEARYTVRGAIRIWNRRVGEGGTHMSELKQRVYK